MRGGPGSVRFASSDGPQTPGGWIARAVRFLGFRGTAATMRLAGPAAYGFDEPAVLHPVGNLRDERLLHELQTHCIALVEAGRRRIILNLEQVAELDTRLIAALVLIIRRARAWRAEIELRLSARVQEWVDLCHVRHLFQPNAALTTQAA